MKQMRLTAALCSAVLLSLCTACGSEPSKTAETTAARTTTAPAVTTAAQTATPVTTAAQTVPSVNRNLFGLSRLLAHQILKLFKAAKLNRLRVLLLDLPKLFLLQVHSVSLL